jgi:acyl-CoA thioesterase FadM
MLSLSRFAYTLLRCHPQPALDIARPVVTRWRVLPGDIDLFGHMNNSRYLVLMDLGRIDFLRRCNLFQGVVRRRWAVPVGGAHLDFRKSLRPFERFELHTHLLHWDERWFYFRQDFVRGTARDRPVCTGYIKTLFVGRAGPVAATEVVQQLLGHARLAPGLSDELRAVFQLARAPAAGEGNEIPAARPEAGRARQPAVHASRTAA